MLYNEKCECGCTLNVWAEVRSAENKHVGFLTGISKVSVCSLTSALFCCLF